MSNLFRQIPKTDELMAHPTVQALITRHSNGVVVAAIREVLEHLREQIKAGTVTTVSAEQILLNIEQKIKQDTRPSLRTVVNGTGVILHTNLGRALLAEEAIEAVVDVAKHYNTLEYDAENGTRGSRYAHMESLICRICGCEAAMVVNNNAAAVMLILGAITKGKEVPVSRGELVEIGGSFRVPEIMEQSGVILREVGATNKTHLQDYEAAINENTGALLKVHTSNFKIMGFTEEVSLLDMTELGHKHNIPVIYDLGGGAFFDLTKIGIEGEPNVFDCVKTGADIISFSGDKLLGGPQAGIIIGKKEYITKMKKHPLTRAFRCDKMTIAALCATLSLYTNPEAAMEKIPTMRMLHMSHAEIDKKAKKLQKKLEEVESCTTEIVVEKAQVGGGSVPSQMLYTRCVAVRPRDKKTWELEEQLRKLDRPIVVRTAKDRLLFCMRTTQTEDFDYIVHSIKSILGE